jgi:hypothetical protein
MKKETTRWIQMMATNKLEKLLRGDTRKLRPMEPAILTEKPMMKL